MNTFDYGNFQIFINKTDLGADDNYQVARYDLRGLSGNYRLTLQSFQIYQTGASSTDSLTPLEIYSPTLILPYGNTTYPVVLYPASDYAKVMGEYNLDFSVYIPGCLELQIRNYLTKLPFTNFQYAILHFKYEKI